MYRRRARRVCDGMDRKFSGQFSYEQTGGWELPVTSNCLPACERKQKRYTRLHRIVNNGFLV